MSAGRAEGRGWTGQKASGISVKATEESRRSSFPQTTARGWKWT